MRLCPLLCALMVLAGCKKPAAPSAPPTGANTNSAPFVSPGQAYLNRAQPKLQTMKIQVGPKEIDVEVAITATEVATGMMFRTNMLDSEGMLFIFFSPQQRSFYMKNCIVPLSAAYIDANGVVDEIVDLHPGVEEPVPSRSHQIKYVLEVPQGWFQRYGVAPGIVITTEKGPLKKFSGVLH